MLILIICGLFNTGAELLSKLLYLDFKLLSELSLSLRYLSSDLSKMRFIALFYILCLYVMALFCVMCWIFDRIAEENDKQNSTNVYWVLISQRVLALQYVLDRTFLPFVFKMRV